MKTHRENPFARPGSAAKFLEQKEDWLLEMRAEWGTNPQWNGLNPLIRAAIIEAHDIALAEMRALPHSASILDVMDEANEIERRREKKHRLLSGISFAEGLARARTPQAYHRGQFVRLPVPFADVMTQFVPSGDEVRVSLFDLPFSLRLYTRKADSEFGYPYAMTVSFGDVTGLALFEDEKGIGDFVLITGITFVRRA